MEGSAAIAGLRPNYLLCSSRRNSPFLHSSSSSTSSFNRKLSSPFFLKVFPPFLFTQTITVWFLMLLSFSSFSNCFLLVFPEEASFSFHQCSSNGFSHQVWLKILFCNCTVSSSLLLFALTTLPESISTGHILDLYRNILN